jgi:hypothetical protein
MVRYTYLKTGRNRRSPAADFEYIEKHPLRSIFSGTLLWNSP